MIGPEELQGFDMLVWLGSGRAAAARSGCSQPTISRQAREVAEKLHLTLQKQGGEWKVRGDTTLLGFERQLHQLHRFLGRASLRLEIGAVCGALIGLPPPDGWMAGPPDRIYLPRSLQLLRQRVIDAWITTAADDLPDPPDPDWLRFDLYTAPVWLVAAADHPLIGVTALSRDDLLAFPSAGIRGGWLPRTEDHLRSRGLWSHPLQLNRYDGMRWDGRTGDGQTLAYASPPMLALNPALRRLEHNLELRCRAALLVHRDHAETAPVAHLRTVLQDGTRNVARVHPELTPCPPDGCNPPG
ncbi:MAG: LysR family transcriptional regulator [Cyanobium sp.]